ncbi:hypothetical protein BC833DRAFT_583017 [Globomyces pollinis-pini]|nr:hypothetical protein BC833DRAFT_583017 [Globomyces pollinis-pini]
MKHSEKKQRIKGIEMSSELIARNDNWVSNNFDDRFGLLMLVNCLWQLFVLEYSKWLVVIRVLIK